KSALPAPAASKVLPPDRPPTVVYENYPRTFNPVPYFAGALDLAPAPEPGALPSRRQLDVAARQVQRVMDFHEIENLQSAYGYYAEKSLWSDVATLFSRDGVLTVDGREHAGPDHILTALQ